MRLTSEGGTGDSGAFALGRGNRMCRFRVGVFREQSTMPRRVAGGDGKLGRDGGLRALDLTLETGRSRDCFSVECWTW